MLGDGCGVTRTVQNADDYEFSVVVDIVDGVIAGEADAKAWRKILARRPGERSPAATTRTSAECTAARPPIPRLGPASGKVRSGSQSDLILSMIRVAVVAEASAAM